jgi:hypothetical protein
MSETSSHNASPEDDNPQPPAEQSENKQPVYQKPAIRKYDKINHFVAYSQEIL